MEFAKIDVSVRTTTGKGVARRTRAAGKVPAVIYGHKLAPISVALDPLALLRSMDKQRRRNTVFSLQVSDGARTEEVTAMIRDAQIDPMSRTIQHVDFVRISLDEEMHVEVPVVLKGTPLGVVNGGTLHHGIHQLAIAAVPTAIPSFIEVDVSALDVGDVLHVSDLKLAKGLRALVDGADPVASVVMLRQEEEVKPAADAATDAAAPGAAAPGGAPAAGAAAGAAPAADAGKKDAKADAGKKDAKK